VSRIEPRAVIASAWQIYRQQAGVLLPVAFALFGISAVVSFAGGDAIALLLALVIATFYQGMVVLLVRDVQDGRRDGTALELLQGVTPVAGPLLVVSILSGLGIGIGLVLILVPGLYLLTIWAVAAPVVVIERTGAMAAFGRSQSLVKGNGWPVFFTVLIVYLISLVLALVVAVASSDLPRAETYLITWVVQSLTAPLTALAAAVLYFELVRARDVDAAGPIGVDDPIPDSLAEPERPLSRPPPGFTG
jgi:hypothetical protein